MNANQITGTMGEKAACKYLLKQGYQIIAQNYRCRFGEVDIIAQDENLTLVFIEVKTRKSLTYGYPAEAVTRKKQKHIIYTSQFYLKYFQRTFDNIRYDVIEIFIDEYNKKWVRHIKNAFGL